MYVCMYMISSIIIESYARAKRSHISSHTSRGRKPCITIK